MNALRKTYLAKFLLCIAVCLFFSLTIFSAVYVTSSSPMDPLTQLEELLERRWSDYTQRHPGWQGSLSVYIDSPTKGTYYATTPSSLGRRVDDHFRAASTTKTFTSSAIMLLNQRGSLSIEEKITAYVTYAIPYADLITVRNLLEHRGGVWDVANEPFTAEGRSYTSDVLSKDKNHQFTIDELVNVIVVNNLTYGPPGSVGYHYSDTGFSILGRIIETLSGQRFDEYISANFLLPNALAATSFPWRAEEQTLPVPFVRAYTWSQNISYRADELNLSDRVAEGNIVTTMKDLANWLIRLFSGQTLLSKTTVASMMVTKPSERDMRYGLGLNYLPGIGYGHDGGIDGYATSAYYDPVDKITIVLSASCINADNIVEYGSFLHDICRDAKKIVG